MAPEWMRLLVSGPDAEAPKISATKARDLLEDDVLGGPSGVASEGDASALLAAVKERLNEVGQGSRYHDFLTAISASTVDMDKALEILIGHADLIARFRQCFAPQADVAADGDDDAMAEEPNMDHRGTEARIGQLVNLTFANMPGHAKERASMVDYVTKRAARSMFPRRLVILRGPPGAGKSEWAQQALRQEVEGGIAAGDALAARLAHICSADDFFTMFKSDGSVQKYSFDAHAFDANQVMNEARVRLAMEIGIEPLYIDNTNMKLWEMRPYIMLADRMGYVVSVVSPKEICPTWDDASVLALRCADKHKQTSDKYTGRPALEAMITEFEPLPEKEDPRHAVRASERPEAEEEGQRFGAQAAALKTLLPPSALLYKFETLLKEGTNLLRYVPPDGKGLGVNGQLGEDWHAFREKGDGSCTYDGRLQWYTEEPETAWSFAELALLEDLHAQAMDLPKADLPSSTSHPSLFANKGKTGPAKKTVGAAAGKKVAPAPPAQTKKPSQALAMAARAEAYVPASRRERFKQRMQNKEGEAEDAPKMQKNKRVASKQEAKTMFEDIDDNSELLSSAPTENEEMSAATFLAAVKSRLTEWGKLDQYHEFVVALSGNVDTKAAVRVLRGHEDLLRVFKSKFAPRSDLLSIKKELAEEPQDGPKPPTYAPGGSPGIVKAELDTGGKEVAPFTPASRYRPGARDPDGPRPPATLPPVKKELGVKTENGVKAELRPEDAPKPPAFPPSAARGTVTIGDESDDEAQDETSIANAVRKGRDECIAQLARTIFRRERAAGDSARQRLAMVRYATKRAARPRFPRELFILRGPPGTGKSEYAMQQLADHVDLEPEEELAARLTHVCSADDFFETFHDEGAVYKFESARLETVHNRNEVRTRFAMEAGIHPLYVDCSNLRLYEMRPYVQLAEKLGYVVSVMEPQDICDRWDDVSFLESANDTTNRQSANKVVTRAMVASLLEAFEPLPAGEDPLQAVLTAQRPLGPRAVPVNNKAPGAMAAPVSAVPDGPRPSAPPRVTGPQMGPRPSGANAVPKPPVLVPVKQENVVATGQKRPSGPASWNQQPWKKPYQVAPRGW